MVRVIMGVKGTGKTKQMIDLINSAVDSEHGNVVCIERGAKLTYDIHSKIRLVEASDYDMTDLTFLKGFISGMVAGNFDITHVFIDSLGRVVLPIELRRILDIDKDTSLEVYVDEDRIILKKYQPACIFCGSADDVASYAGRNICKACREAISALK